MDEEINRSFVGRLTHSSAGSERFSETSASQPAFLRARVRIRYPDSVIGKHFAFPCMADDGHYYYCKDDLDGHPAKATEWLATHLARLVDLPVADCAVIEHEGFSYFGSRQVTSMDDQNRLAEFLATPFKDELGGQGIWPGEHLAMVRAFDMFIDNPDRNVGNFVLDRPGAMPRLVAIDFASARLLNGSVDRFPVVSESTMLVGKIHEKIHGVHTRASFEMLDRLEKIPASIGSKLITDMPEEWATARQKGTWHEFWENGTREQRIANLRAALR